MRSSLAPLLTLLAFPLHAATNAEIVARADEYLRIRTDMGAFSGSVLIARDGEVILRRGYGYADVEHRKRFTPETQSEVASLSKMFTAMAALKLRDDGKLRLDDPICNYLSPCPDAWKAITVDQLIHHTSGIPDYESALEMMSPKYFAFMTQANATQRIFDEAKLKPLDFTPGTKFNYSNTGYIVLAHVIERAAGQPFAKFVRERLLKPARMSHSGVLGTGETPRNLAFGYTHGELGWPAILAGVPLTEEHLERRPGLPLTPPAGEAWLYSTVDDLYRWSSIMDGSALVPKREADEVFTPALEGYGAGWFIGTGLGHRRFRHTGSLPGYTSEFIKFPDERITIIILCNLDRAPMVHITRNLSLIALGQPYDMPVRGSVVALTAEQEHALEGAYRKDDGTVLTVRKDPRFLLAEMRDRYSAGLIPLSPTRFYMPLSDGVVTFVLDAAGLAQTVNVHYSAEDRVFTRVQ